VGLSEAARLERVDKRLRVVLQGVTLADTTQGKRVLETSHPPVYYFPAADVGMHYLLAGSASSFCEWKGTARYFDVNVAGKLVRRAAWAYPDPTSDFVAIKDHLAFYAQMMDACFVGDEQASPQPGSFYGGWITNDIIGPFKGEPDARRTARNTKFKGEEHDNVERRMGHGDEPGAKSSGPASEDRSFQLMAVLAFMWSAIFCLSAGLFVWFPEFVFGHVALLMIGIFGTGYIFRVRTP
jgi:uncharacterized protein (DUF427 family)